MKSNVTEEFLNSCSRSFKQSNQKKLVMNAIIKNGIDAAAINNEHLTQNQPVFSCEIDTGKVTNQKNSGRCWMFAGLNVLRQRIIEKYNIKDFELSQCYVMFWDKLEKCNYFLESIIGTSEEEADSRVVMWILDNPIADGGQWDMFANIVEKYGVVPKCVMPETFHSSKSPRMNNILATKLRKGAIILRKLHKDGKNADEIRIEKEKIMSDIYRILCCFLGNPPKKIDFEYRDNDKKFYSFENLSPVDFYEKFIGINIRDYVSIINAPSNGKKFDTTYTVKYLGNVCGGVDIKYLNVDINTLKKLALKQLKDNEAVWFGCDVGKMSNSDAGVMDSDLYDYSTILNTDLSMTKGERLDYGESCLTHAMVLTGVDIKNDKAKRWKVENSWGEEKGNKGYFVMSDAWFDEYTYQIVINKKYLSDKLMKAYKKEPIVLEPWDPMGSLAI